MDVLVDFSQCQLCIYVTVAVLCSDLPDSLRPQEL